MKARAVNIAEKIKLIKDYSHSNGLAVFAEKPINYGVQLKISQADAIVSINVYQGKKGVSVVIGGADSELKRSLQNFASSQKIPNVIGALKSADPVSVWAGSDEAGKGDYFGPLAVAAVGVDKIGAALLAEIGVRDCKKLDDEKVTFLAAKIKKIAHVCFAEATIFPGEYNEKYADLTKHGYNLNDLLAQLHAQVAQEIFAQRPDIEKFIVDRFATDTALGKWFKLPNCVKLINIPKAESDIAVAAASILARANFLQGLGALNDELSLTLPKGAAGHVTHYAAKILKDRGEDVLSLCAKKHFKNSRDIAGIFC